MMPQYTSSMDTDAQTDNPQNGSVGSPIKPDCTPETFQDAFSPKSYTFTI
jgi:hypothetical protein